MTVGTLDARSIIEPTRFIARHKKRQIDVIEGEVENVDHKNRTVTFIDTSDIKGETTTTTIPYDYLIYGIGAENATFGIPGVKEHACFLKEVRAPARDSSDWAALGRRQAPPQPDGLSVAAVRRLLIAQASRQRHSRASPSQRSSACFT